MKSPFDIREHDGNKSGSIPAHWDIHVNDCDDSLCTVWDSREMAEEFVKFLEQYPKRAKERGDA